MTDASTRKRVQAVLFAAIMVVSMVAAGVGGFAGSAAANITGINDISAEDVNVGDTDQTQNVTLEGVSKSDEFDDINVSLEGSSASVEDAEVANPGDFGEDFVFANTGGDGDFFIDVEGQEAESGNITVEVTLDTSDADPGGVTYEAVSGSGASASGSFEILADDSRNDESDGILPVDREADGAYDTIQEAINNAESGDIVEVATGTYEESINVNVSNLTVRPASDADPVLKNSLLESGGSIAAGGESMINVSADDVTIRGLTVETQPSDGAPPSALAITADDVSVIGNDLSHNQDSSGNPVLGAGGNDPLIENNNVTNGPIAYYGSGSADILGNDIDGGIINEAIWSTTDGELTIENNDITDATTGVSSGEDLKFTSSDVSVNGEAESDAIINAVTNDNNGVETVEIAGSLFASGGSLTVENGESIQAALDNVSKFGNVDTVEIESGIYEQSVTVDTPNVTVRPASDADPVLKNSLLESGGSIAAGGESMINVSADDVTIRGLTVETQPADGAPPSALAVTADDVSVIGNDLSHNQDSSGNPVLGAGGNDPLIENNNVTNGPIAYYGSGSADILGNDIDGNIINEAIWSTTDGELTIRNNDITDATTGVSSGEDLKFTSSDVSVNDETESGAILNAVTNDNDGVETVEIAGNLFASGGSLTVENGESIQATLNNASKFDNVDTVELESGNYYGRTIVKTDVTIRGEGVEETVLYANSSLVNKNFEPTLSIYADASVENLSVVREVTTAPESDGHTNAIGIAREEDGAGTTATLSNVDVTLNDETGTDSFGNAIWVNSFNAVNGGDRYPVNATLDNVDVQTNIGPNTDKFGGAAVGIYAVDKDVDVEIRESSFTDSPRGVYVTQSNAGADASVVYSGFNNVSTDIVNQGANRVSAQLNYFGDDAPSVTGDVAYDPVLTTPIDNVEGEPVGDITEYGSVLEVNNDGGDRTLAVGFSAPPEQNASELFDDVDIEGNAYRYDNDGAGYVEIDADFTPTAGEVIVITTDDAVDEDVVVPIDTSVEGAAANPESVEVNNGWNLVATGAADTVSDIPVALNGGSIQSVTRLQAQPRQPGLANRPRFGAFQATWLFINGDGRISTGYAEGQNPFLYNGEVLYPPGQLDDIDGARLPTPTDDEDDS